MAAAAHQIATPAHRVHLTRCAAPTRSASGDCRTRNPNPHTRARVHPHTAHPIQATCEAVPQKPTYTYDQFGRMTRKTGGDTTKYGYGAGWDVLNEDGPETCRRPTSTLLRRISDTRCKSGPSWPPPKNQRGHGDLNYPPTADPRHIPSKIPGGLYAYRYYSPDANRWLTRGRWAWSTARMFMRMW